ncbi:hypothetical protein T484DRAFT_1874979 [Baffinella frigidus]|nr:hypothetical protein T484DRAFT_1874979 [Cryptophyta sp. CCMP2293]
MVALVDEATGEVRWQVQAHPWGAQPDAWALHPQPPPAVTHASSVEVAMSPGGRFVASIGEHDCTWKLWSAENGTLHNSGKAHDGLGPCVCGVHALGHYLVEPRAGCPVVAHTEGLRALAFAPSGQRLATGGLDGSVVVGDVESGEAILRMGGNSVGGNSGAATVNSGGSNSGAATVNSGAATAIQAPANTKAIAGGEEPAASQAPPKKQRVHKPKCKAAKAAMEN